mgnify:CR=1 FL=1
MKISVDTEISSSKDKVWAAISNIENAPDMISGIIALEVLHKPDSGLVGLKWKETRKMFGKDAEETMWITDSKEGEYYATRAENHGAIYKSQLAVEAVGDKTKLTMTFEGDSESFLVKIMSVVMGFFMKKSMIKMLQADLADIKRFVEAQA